MAVQRIQISKNKKANHSKHQKREVANLLAGTKEELARIRVEHIIREDFNIEALEVLELMCELVFERTPVIAANKVCPEDLLEAVSSIVWASTQVNRLCR